MVYRVVPEHKKEGKCVVTGLAFRISNMVRVGKYQRIVRVPGGHGQIISEYEKLQKPIWQFAVTVRRSMVVAVHPGTTDIWTDIAFEKVIDRPKKKRVDYDAVSPLICTSLCIIRCALLSLYVQAVIIVIVTFFFLTLSMSPLQLLPLRAMLTRFSRWPMVDASLHGSSWRRLCR